MRTWPERLIEQTCAKQGIAPHQLTIHADRGAPMRSKRVALLFSDLGIDASHSRPRVSNDNPFSEAQFRTLKYRPAFPDRFRLAHTRARRQPRSVRVVQRCAPPQRAHLSDAGRRPLRPRRDSPSRSGTARAWPRTPPIPSDSCRGRPVPKRCLRPCGSTGRRNRPARMPQERRSSPRTTHSMG